MFSTKSHFLTAVFLGVLSLAAQAVPTSQTPARDPRAVALFDQSLKAYRQLKALRVVGREEMMLIPASPTGKIPPLLWQQTFEWKRPSFSRSVVKAPPSSQITSGVWISDGRFLFQDAETKTREDMGTPDGPRVLFCDHLLRWLLMGKSPLERFSEVRSTAQVKTAGRATKAGMLCEGVKIIEAMAANDTRTRFVWFDARTHLLRAVEEVRETRAQKAQDSLIVKDNVFFDRVQLNPKFAPATFSIPEAPAPQRPRASLSERFSNALFPDALLRVGNTAPAIEGTDVNGRKCSLGALKGRVVVVEFWGTWCGPCVRNLQHLLHLRQTLKTPFEIIAVSLDTDKAAPRQFAREHNISVPILCDGLGTEGANVKRYGLAGVPFCVVVGKDGRIATINPEGEDVDKAVRATLTRNG